MKTCLFTCMVALTGFAGCSLAQTAIVAVHADKSTAVVGEDVTWSVYVAWTAPHPDAYVFGLNFQFQSSLNGTTTVLDGTGADTIGPGTVFFGGQQSGASIDNVSFSDLAMISVGHPGGGANPFFVGTYTASASAEGAWSYFVEKKTAGTSAAIWLAKGDVAHGTFVEWNMHDSSEFFQFSSTVQVVPGVPVFAFGSVVSCFAGQRRRR